MRAVLFAMLLFVSPLALAEEAGDAAGCKGDCPFCQARELEKDCRVTADEVTKPGSCDTKTCGKGECAKKCASACSEKCTDCPCVDCPGGVCKACPCNSGDGDKITAAVEALLGDRAKCASGCCSKTAVVAVAGDKCKCDPCKCDPCECGKDSCGTDKSQQIVLQLRISTGDAVLAAPRVTMLSGGTATVESRELKCKVSVKCTGDDGVTPLVATEPMDRHEEEWLLLGKHRHSVAKGPVTLDDVTRR